MENENPILQEDTVAERESTVAPVNGKIQPEWTDVVKRKRKKATETAHAAPEPRAAVRQNKKEALVAILRNRIPRSAAVP